MALTSYFNTDAIQTAKPEMFNDNEFEEPQALATLETELLCFQEDLVFPNTLLDSSTYIDPQNFISPEFFYPNLLPYSYTTFDPFVNETSPLEDNYDLVPFEKRRKCCENTERPVEFSPIFFDGYGFTSCFDVPKLCPEMPELKLEMAGGVSDGNSKFEKKGNNEKSVSAQSIAARERRRKITERTRELGKLIPGGSKMNTASMFHAASKYVKYLQAQIMILELMGNLEESKELIPVEDLELLLASTSVQEKLYMEESCLVPKNFIPVLANHHDVQSRPSILRDLNLLIGTHS